MKGLDGDNAITAAWPSAAPRLIIPHLLLMLYLVLTYWQQPH